MRADLRALLAEVEADELTAAAFTERLVAIHRHHLGAASETRELVRARRRALKAFEGLAREAPSRHHELEQLAEALGLGQRNPGSG